MSPDEILDAVARRGVALGRGALSWYARQGLIPRPTLRSLGRGQGSSSEYPPETVAELLVANTLMGKTILYFSDLTPMTRSMAEHDMTDFLRKRITADDIAEARRRYYAMTPRERTVIQFPHPAPTAEEAWNEELLLGWAKMRAIELQKDN